MYFNKNQLLLESLQKFIFFHEIQANPDNLAE